MKELKFEVYEVDAPERWPIHDENDKRKVLDTYEEAVEFMHKMAKHEWYEGTSLIVQLHEPDYIWTRFQLCSCHSTKAQWKEMKEWKR